MATDTLSPSKNGKAKESGSKAQRETMERVTLELADELKQDFRDRDLLYRDIDAILYGEVPIDIPEAYRKTAIEVRSPLAMHIATSVVAALSVNPVSVVFKPLGFGDVHQANSSLREHFFEASWVRQEHEAQRQLRRLFMWSLAVKGEGILKTVERARTAWGDYDKQAEKYLKEIEEDEDYDQDAKDRLYNAKTEEMKLTVPYPIATTDVPPETFYYTKNENGLTSVVEIKEMPYVEALERFGAGLDRNGNVVAPDDLRHLDHNAAQLARAEWSEVMRSSRSNTVRCIEAWDHECQVILLSGPGQRGSGSSKVGSGTLCRVLKHSYGDPLLKVLRGPYFHALGITTASRMPEHAGLSILFGFLRLFPLLDSLLTMQANAAYMTGFPAFKRTLPPNSIPGIPQPPYGADGREKGSGESVTPGKLYPFDIAPIDQPKAGAEAEKLIQNIRGFLELALPSVVQGLVASDQSGYALNQAAYLARLSWDPIVSNAQVALADRTGFESRLIEQRIGEKVYAWGEQEVKSGHKGPVKAGWLGVGPGDLKGVHRYEVRLDPSTPSNDIIQTRALGEKMQLKLISYEDAVEAAGSNPDEVELSWTVHDLKSSPEIQQMIKEETFKKVATLQQKRMKTEGLPTPAQLAAGGGPMSTGQQAAAGALGGPVPGGPPPPGVGGMPGNPVPSPGMGLPIAPPTGGMPGIPGQPPGAPVVPGVPSNALPLPGA